MLQAVGMERCLAALWLLCLAVCAWQHHEDKWPLFCEGGSLFVTGQIGGPVSVLRPLLLSSWESPSQGQLCLNLCKIALI